MASIDQYIDTAVVLMKERAARFDNAGKRPMDEWVQRDGAEACAANLTQRALSNLHNARLDLKSVPMRHLVRQDLLDVMNLCALALSVLPQSDER